MQSRRPLTRRRFVQAGAAAAGIAGLAPRAIAAPFPRPEKARLTMGIPLDAASFMPVYVAAARTWKQQGLDVELISFRGDAEVSQALAGGSIDLSLQSLDGLINLINAGQPVKGFYAGFYQSDFAWLAQPQIKQLGRSQGQHGGRLDLRIAHRPAHPLRAAAQRPRAREGRADRAGRHHRQHAAGAARRSGSALAILSPPFKWMAAEAGFNQLGAPGPEIAPQWPKHAFVAKTKFLDDNPEHACGRSCAPTSRPCGSHAPTRRLAVDLLVERLKWTKPYAQRAYEEMMPAYDERGTLPDAHMDVFWSIEKQGGAVNEAWPDAKLIDDRFIKSFADWAP